MIPSTGPAEETMFTRAIATVAATFRLRQNRRLKPAATMVCLLLLGSAMFAQDARPKYPATKIDNVVDIMHGVKIVDPYRWLEEGDNAQVKEWVEEQNKFTQAILGKV